MKQKHLEVNLDDVLLRVGVFGKWQQKIVFMLMVASFIGGKENEIVLHNSYPTATLLIQV